MEFPEDPRVLVEGSGPEWKFSEEALPERLRGGSAGLGRGGRTVPSNRSLSGFVREGCYCDGTRGLVRRELQGVCVFFFFSV